MTERVEGGVCESVMEAERLGVVVPEPEPVCVCVIVWLKEPVSVTVVDGVVVEVPVEVGV